jgi:peroxiredoxin
MKSRWIAAAAATCAVALLTVPMLLRTAPGSSAEALVPAHNDRCEAGSPARFDFTLKDHTGSDVKLADYKGKVVLLNFWATWCGPCKIEIPWFNEFQQKYQARGFVVLGISADDTVEQLKPFVAQYKMAYPVLVGLGRDDVQEALGPVWGLPTTLLINREGKVCQRHMGLAKKDEFEKGILGLL